jgi:hypothetical protein
MAVRKPTGALAQWGATTRPRSRLLGSVEQHLLTRPDEWRDYSVLHAGEIAKKDWCPRSSFLRLRHVDAGGSWTRPMNSFQLDNIFDEGHSIHDKWQGRLWDMGVLWGLFVCTVCGHQKEELAPEFCKPCGARRESLRYREVHLSDPEYRLVGHGDGEIWDDQGRVLLEIKSIGVGTIRSEAPRLLAEYTREVAGPKPKKILDMEALWRDLHYPFPSHLRQGWLYLWMRKLRTDLEPIDQIVFVYENKAIQAVKEYSVELDMEGVEAILDDCQSVIWALENDREPGCRNGRQAKACANCKVAEEEISGAARKGNAGRAPRPEREPVATTAAPSVGRTRIARRPDRSRGSGPDVDLGSVHSVGRLLGGSAGNGRRR